ncbi:MAG: hypothetical protein ABSH46_04205 [Bryobacteraceae bacterium]|jgi:hypothetical protein
MCRSLLPALLCLASAQAAVTNIRLVGSTPTQAVIAYTAPDSSACMMEVSESASYTPLVHDVDPALFSGANLDNRAGNIADGRARTFVIGKRAAEMASDGKYYSRALQVLTPHYYRITCGSDTATGTFTTQNIALGTMYNEPFARDPARPGRYAYPTMDYTYPTTAGNGTLSISGTAVTFAVAETIAVNDYIVLTSGPNAGQQRRVDTVTNSKHVVLDYAFRRGRSWITNIEAGTTWAKRTPEKTSTQVIIDPRTGLLVRRISNAQALDGSPYGGLVAPTIVTPGAGWTNASTVSLATADSNAASYVGDANNNWLFVHVPSGFTNYNEGPWDMDWITVTLQGSGTGSGNDNNIDLCLTADASTCRSAILTVNLNTCAPWSQVSSQCWVGTEVPLEQSWQSSSDVIGSLLDPVEMNAPTGGLLIRKSTTTSNTVSLDYVAVNLGLSWPGEEHTMAAQNCSNALATQTYNGTTRSGYRCVFGSSGAVGYWIDDATGDSVVSTVYQIPSGWRYAGASGANFDKTDPTKLYGSIPISGKTAIVLTTYTGQNLDTGFTREGQYSPITVTTLVPDVVAAMAAFSSDFAAHEAYWNTLLVAGLIDNRYLHVDFLAGGVQDQPGYKGIFDVQTKQFIAATSTLSFYPDRWCKMHTGGTSGETTGGWAEISASDMYWGPTCGNGPIQTELAQALGTAGIDPSTDATCPSPMPVQSQWRATTGGTNRCSSVLVSGDLYKASTSCSAENTLRGANGFLGPMQAAQPGDIFTIESERVQLLSKASECGDPNASCKWTVLRGVDATGVASHSSTTVVYPNCAALSLVTSKTSWNDTYWDFLDDPNGADTTMTYKKFIPATHGTQFTGPDTNHLTIVRDVSAGCGLGSIGWGCYLGFTGSVPDAAAENMAGAPAHILNESPAFANLPGQTGDSHPGQLQASDYSWILDALTYNPPSQTWTQVSGTLYKATAVLHPKILPTEAVCDRKPAVNVSPGPITSTSGDNYKFCYGSSCYSGAGVNDIYMNCPGTSTLSCPDNTDVGMCVHDLSPTSPVFAQVGITLAKDRNGSFERLLGQPFGSREDDGYKHLDASPDGKWGFFLARWLDGMRTENMAMKLPPWPAKDSINRGTFIPMLTPVGAVPSGTNNVVVEFGYDTGFHCTSRQEACEAVGARVNETTPFYWASENYSGFTGAPRMIVIPAISQRVLYYRLKYRDAANAEIATGPTQVQVVP